MKGVPSGSSRFSVTLSPVRLVNVRSSTSVAMPSSSHTKPSGPQLSVPTGNPSIVTSTVGLNRLSAAAGAAIKLDAIESCRTDRRTTPNRLDTGALPGARPAYGRPIMSVNVEWLFHAICYIREMQLVRLTNQHALAHIAGSGHS